MSRRGPRLASLAYLAAGGLAAISLLSTGIVVVAHLGDRYNIDHVAGIWIGLASYVSSGTFYPSLYDSASFGGTRYMPVYFLLHSVAAQLLGGNYVLSGKLLSLGIVISLITLTFVIIRRFGVPRSFALLLATLVLLTDPGFDAATGIRADSLATLFQLGAVALVAHLGPRLAPPAAALAALAFFTKLSALWAPAAIALWLFLYYRRDFLLFAATFIGFVFAFALAAQIASDGRLLENLATMAFAGVDREFAIQKSTLYTLAILLTSAPAIWVLVPFMLGSCALAARGRQLTVYHLAWLASVIILVVVMTDRGTDVNQLIEPLLLGAIILGALWRADGADISSPFGLVLAMAILWGGGNAFALHLRARTQEVVVPLARGGRYTQPKVDTLLATIHTGTRVLAEDASISIARGDVPVVIDAWAVPKIETGHPEWVAHFAGRVDAAEFDYVILLFRFEVVDPAFEGWYAAQFGKTVMSAIKRRYNWVGEMDGFHVYAPR